MTTTQKRLLEMAADDLDSLHSLCRWAAPLYRGQALTEDGAVRKLGDVLRRLKKGSPLSRNSKNFIRFVVTLASLENDRLLKLSGYDNGDTSREKDAEIAVLRNTIEAQRRVFDTQLRQKHSEILETRDRLRALTEELREQEMEDMVDRMMPSRPLLVARAS